MHVWTNLILLFKSLIFDNVLISSQPTHSITLPLSLRFSFSTIFLDAARTPVFGSLPNYLDLLLNYRTFAQQVFYNSGFAQTLRYRNTCESLVQPSRYCYWYFLLDSYRGISVFLPIYVDIAYGWLWIIGLIRLAHQYRSMCHSG